MISGYAKMRGLASPLIFYITYLPDIRVHDLRHSHVSMLIHMGFSVVAIAERMGHETTDITFRYAHLLPNSQGAMADALNSAKNIRE